MRTATTSRHRQGFTLVELAIASLIVAILSGIALLRLINLGSDERVNKAQSILAAVRSASKVVHDSALTRNQTGASGSVTVDGISITTAYGYPAGIQTGDGAGGIVDAAGMDISGNNDAGITLTGGGSKALVISINGAHTAANCAVSYTAPVAADTAPIIALITTGC